MDNTPKISHQEKIDLAPQNIAEKVVSFEAQQSSQIGTKQEVVEDSPPMELTMRPPPGFERLQPSPAVQQNIMAPPQSYSYGTPIVQQNYFLPPYGGAYQLPYGYASNYPLQMPYNYFPMYTYQQMVPSIVPPQIPAQLEPIITEYLNSLKNDTSAIVETEKSDTSDSDLIVCGSLANKHNDQNLQRVDAKVKIEEIAAQNESEENTKKKKTKQKKQKTSESEQKETVTKLKQEDEETKTNPNKEVATHNKTKIQEEQKTPKRDVNKQHTPEKNKIEKNSKVDKTKENIKTTECKQSKIEKDETNKSHKTKENASENSENKLTPSKTKVSEVETNIKTEKGKSQSNKTSKRKENVDISENAEHTEAKSKHNKASSLKKSKTDKDKSKNDKENEDIFDNKLTQSKTEVVEGNSKTEKTVSVSNEYAKIIDIPEKSENTVEQKTKVSLPVETVDNWEELIDDACLLDTNEAQLVAILSRPGSRNDSEQQLDVLEQFLIDTTAPLLPQKLPDCDPKDECVEEIIERTTQIEPQKFVETKGGCSVFFALYYYYYYYFRKKNFIFYIMLVLHNFANVLTQIASNMFS